MVRDSRQYESWGVRNIDIDRNRPIIILIDHDEREKKGVPRAEIGGNYEEKEELRRGAPGEPICGSDRTAFMSLS